MTRHLVHALSALLAVSTVTAGPFTDIFKKTTGVISSELLTIKDPIDKTVTNVLSSQCENLKQLLRVGYDQVPLPDLSKLTLNFYTRDIQVVFKLSEAAELIPTSRWFKKQSKIIIYMHGFTDDPTKDSYKNISNAFLMQGDYNVLALDSSSLLGLSTLYIGATTNVRYIGEQIGAVLANMTKVGSSPSSMYLIGHSLGAHIASFTGKSFTALTGARVGRITGLDPAGPCFTHIDDDLKLKATDADFVDVMHTDAGVYGLNEQIGHVDFFPNSGSLQPSCFFQTCSHSRAWLMYAETVLITQNMPAVACDSWNQFKEGKCNTSKISLMGYSCDPSTRGRYYLQTNGEIPYGLGSVGLTYINKDGVLRNVGSAIGII